MADWVRRIAAVPHAPVLGAGLLALAGMAQAITQAYAAPLRDVPGGDVLYAVLLCLFVLACTVPIAFLRPAGSAVAITAACVLSFTVSGTVTVAGVAAMVIASYLLGRTSTQFLALGLAVPFLGLALVSRGDVSLLLAGLVPVAAGAGMAVRARGQAREQSAARTAATETLTEHMARGERARIARELHDVVAHHISVIAVQAETARLTTPGLPAAGAQRLQEIGDTARAGLTEMRRLLGVLREDAAAEKAERHPQPGLRQLASLVDTARGASGATMRLIVSGPVAEFDPGVELAAYRIVQEALTNARRHAPGTAVDVELRYDDDWLRLRVRDNGPGPAPSRHGTGSAGHGTGSTGHGLLGMRERAAAVGGTLRTGASAGGGFLVEAVLPAKPEAAP
jgi:signal transduction histidine kinase